MRLSLMPLARPLKTFKTLHLFLSAALLLNVLSCAKELPLVTLNQLDVVHNRVNPLKILKYNKESCQLELEQLPSYPLIQANSPMHGAICLTPEDYTKYKNFLETECENNKPKVTPNVDRTNTASRR